MKIVYVLLCLLQINGLKCANILGIFPFPGRSHILLGNVLMKLLVEKGHNVTIITPSREGFTPKSGEYTEIIIDDLIELGREENSFDIARRNPFYGMTAFTSLSIELCRSVYDDVRVKNLLESNAHFDVVIVESFVFDSLFYFAEHFNASLILLNSFWSNFYLNLQLGNPQSLSYAPVSRVINHRSIFGRLKNVCLVGLYYTFVWLVYYPKHNNLLKNYFPNAPDVRDIKVDLALINSHSSINFAIPHVPNLIEIGGFHLQPEKKLPEDLQKILDDAKEGFIYFSLGSSLKAIHLPEDKRKAFLQSFKKLKYKVLWKWENETMSDKPSNVIIRKWFPQQDILAHPNIKLFITHCGLLSTTETIYYGIPMLAIPVFGDQPVNAASIKRHNYGVFLPYAEVTEEAFDEKLNEVLNNDLYRKNVKRGSALYYDRPENPADLAVYWVEYVIRHRNVDHLKTAALDLAWYENALLDVYFLIIVIILTIVYIIRIIFRIFRILFNKCRKTIYKNKKE